LEGSLVPCCFVLTSRKTTIASCICPKPISLTNWKDRVGVDMRGKKKGSKEGRKEDLPGFFLSKRCIIQEDTERSAYMTSLVETMLSFFSLIYLFLLF
jgi:hypothetical protein